MFLKYNIVNPKQTINVMNALMIILWIPIKENAALKNLFHFAKYKFQIVVKNVHLVIMW